MDAELVRAGADLAHTRDEFVLTMGLLEHEITRTLDWREWVRRRPATVLAFAFGLGLFLGRKH
jgi:hypothetical protein